MAHRTGTGEPGLYLIADDRTFALPVGYSDRLHARLQEEITNDEAGMPPD
jgi:hypothetical protein